MSTGTTSTVQARRSWGEYLAPAARVQVVVVAGLFLAAYWTTLQRLAWTWTNDGNWSHGWLVPLFSLYFLFTRQESLFRTRLNPSYLGAVLLAASVFGGFVVGWVYGFFYPQALTLITSLIALMLLFGGRPLLRVTWFPILFLVFAIPLPQDLYVKITLPLRVLASQVAAVVLPLFAPGLITDEQNVVIEWAYQGRMGTLNVEEACSGMRLMMAFVTLGVATAYLGDRPLWQRLVMVASCVPIAIFCNATRVTITGLLHIYGYEDQARGTAHGLLGIVMLLLALGCFSLIGYILSHLFVEEPADTSASPVVPGSGRRGSEDRS